VVRWWERNTTTPTPPTNPNPPNQMANVAWPCDHHPSIHPSIHTTTQKNLSKKSRHPHPTIPPSLSPQETANPLGGCPEGGARVRRGEGYPMGGCRHCLSVCLCVCPFFFPSDILYGIGRGTLFFFLLFSSVFFDFFFFIFIV
jgi:hypothetical protein